MGGNFRALAMTLGHASSCRDTIVLYIGIGCLIVGGLFSLI
jgi:hypothetical protein